METVLSVGSFDFYFSLILSLSFRKERERAALLTGRSFNSVSRIDSCARWEVKENIHVELFLSNDFFPLLDEFSSIKNRQNPSFDNLIEYIDISFGAAGLKNEIKVNVTNISSSLYFPRSERGKRGPSYFSSIKAKVSGVIGNVRNI